MNKERLEDNLAGAIIFLIVGVVVMGLYFIAKDDADKLKEKNNTVNTYTKKNDSIKVELNKLDSLENVEVTKIKTLDNDSTLELFYVLIRE